MNKLLIRIRDLVHEYREYDENDVLVRTSRALDGVTLDVTEGSFVAVLGHNGSGKSTFAKHINALLMPTEGTVIFSGRDTAEIENLWELRKEAGMIFQNPDNQIISNVVEEDVAFGPENLGIPSEEIIARVAFALERVGMEAYRLSSPNKLSGGQKQRIGIAGLLAMKPRCILMDEPTAMLDPVGRREVLRTVHELNRDEHITVVMITHYLEEVTDVDRVVVMDQGKIVMDGTPREIFSRIDELSAHHMRVPQVVELAYELRKEGVPIPEGILTVDELVEALCRLR
ncbi:MAG: energy-coupling factor transporter ATPase [Lachnospiraceae bacterium]|nr:energy-coupling factor transporter ATPase [Lachnospiraceae bacterium]